MAKVEVVYPFTASSFRFHKNLPLPTLPLPASASASLLAVCRQTSQFARHWCKSAYSSQSRNSSNMYSRYGIITWVNALKTCLNSVSARINDMLRAINFSSTYQNVNNLYKSFELLKLQDLHRLT